MASTHSTILQDPRVGLDKIDGLRVLSPLPATKDIKYFGGIFVHGPMNEEVKDPDILAEEISIKARIEEEDTVVDIPHFVSLRNRGFRVDFLLSLTFALDLWDVKTWQVVQMLVKPATQETRCRFADLPNMHEFTGPATVFVSHCWGGKWGDVIAATCTGARMDRYVWIDIFAVRQWPGNAADLDFRGVISQCIAVLVAAAPLVGSIITERFFEYETDSSEYLESQEFRDAQTTLPFARLWCVVELHAAATGGKPIVFRCVRTEPAAGSSSNFRRVVSQGAQHMLSNFSFMVDVESSACAAPEDKVRELAVIGKGNIQLLNMRVSVALKAGASAAKRGVFEVDNYACGEPEALRSLSSERLKPALEAACSLGHTAAVVELVEMIASTESIVDFSSAVVLAAQNGCDGILKVLRENGVDLSKLPPEGATLRATCLAAQNGHAGVISCLRDAGVDLNATDDTGCTPAFIAAQNNHALVLKILIENDVDLEVVNSNGDTAVLIAAQKGHTEILALLRDAKANLNATDRNEWTAAYTAAHFGNTDIMFLLATAKANVCAANADGVTPAYKAAQTGRTSILKILAAHEADLSAAAKNGNTLAYAAAQNGHVEVVCLLRDHGAALDSQNKVLMTPLFIAAQEGHVAIVQILCESGANLEAANKNGLTPAMVASQNGHLNVLKVLHESGANLFAANKKGETAADIATKKGHLVIVEFILSALKASSSNGR